MFVAGFSKIRRTVHQLRHHEDEDGNDKYRHEQLRESESSMPSPRRCNLELVPSHLLTAMNVSTNPAGTGASVAVGSTCGGQLTIIYATHDEAQGGNNHGICA